MASSALSLVADNTQRRTFGRYVVTGELGRGAMGSVYRAEDPLIERKVALKVLAMDVYKGGQSDFRLGFFREAKAAGRLSHPNIVTIYDVGESEGTPYIAMEYLTGLTLRDELDRGAVLPVRRVVDIAILVARGLDYAHQHGVIHRDIKPANIMLTRNGVVKIMDFGIAKAPDVGRTTSDSVLGSPRYMAPEQIANGPVDARTDIFALGVTLYEMLTGKDPFAGENIPAVMNAILHGAPPSPRALNPDVPLELDTIVMRAMAKSPSERYDRAKDMARALAAVRRVLRDSKAAAVPREIASAGPDDATQVVDFGPARRPESSSGSGPDPAETVRIVPPPPPTTAAGEAPVRKGRGRIIAAALATGALVVMGALLSFQDKAPEQDEPPAPPLLAQAAAEPPASAEGPGAESPETGTPSAPAATPAAGAAPEDPAEPAAAEPEAPPPEPAEPPARKKVTPPPRKKAETAAAGERTSATAPATVVLGVLPWGEVKVNGIGRGVTPPLRDLVLPPGKYRIEIHNADFPPYVETVTLESGASHRISHRFQ